MPTRANVGAIAIAMVAALGCAAACNSSPDHLLSAQLYEAARSCVDPATAIDLQQGAGADSPCAAACIVSSDRVSVYVTTQCPPFPPDFDATSTNPSCAPALAALAAGAICGLPPVDASTND